MRDFKILPVLDLLKGVIVHAVKGERQNYKPLDSYLFKKPDPNLIINILHNKYKFNDFYIADLDAIMESKPNYELISEILKNTDISFLLDPGINKLEEVIEFSSLGVRNLILGLETLEDKDTIQKIIQSEILKNVYVSVDMYAEKILTRIKEYQNLSILNIIRDLKDLGVSKIILLDLKKVGSKNGGIPLLYKEIRDNFKGDVFVGGGIKDLTDVLDYYYSGFSGLMIGTALYDGTINLKELTSLIDKNYS